MRRGWLEGEERGGDDLKEEDATVARRRRIRRQLSGDGGGGDLEKARPSEGGDLEMEERKNVMENEERKEREEEMRE